LVLKTKKVLVKICCRLFGLGQGKSPVVKVKKGIKGRGRLMSRDELEAEGGIRVI